MKKSYHSIVVPTALAMATRRASARPSVSVVDRVPSNMRRYSAPMGIKNVSAPEAFAVRIPLRNTAHATSRDIYDTPHLRLPPPRARDRLERGRPDLRFTLLSRAVRLA